MSISPFAASTRSARRRRPLELEVLEGRTLPAGTWTALANPAPSPTGILTMVLLTDGTVLAEGGGLNNTWYRLAPDARGSYVNGTWSQAASMNTLRLNFPSNVLPSGNFLVLGGELSGPNDAFPDGNTGEVYNPVTDSWAPVATFPLSHLGDDPTELLADGDVLTGSIEGPETYLYHPATNTWSETGNLLHGDDSGEEGWVTLPDGSVLSVDVTAANVTGIQSSQRYIPATGAWVDAGTVPVPLSTHWELGPGFLLPDGRVLYFGDNGNTAYYTPSTNSWAAGPTVPDGLGFADVPGAELPDGHILIGAGPNPHGGGVDGPTTIFDFDPTTDTFTDVTPDSSVIDTSGSATWELMLLLPTGQVLLTTTGDQLAVYTPDGSADPSWQPTVSSLQSSGGLTWTLTGTQLNGLSEGTAYGDDAEMSSNYPLVQLTDGSGNVTYARTFNWSSQVQTGSAPVTTQFALPAALPVGPYSLSVIANGIESAPVPFYAPLSVVSSTPADGSVVSAPPTSFTVTFNEPVDPDTLAIGALHVNGLRPNGVSLDPTDTVATFTYTTSPVTAQGAQTMSIATARIARQEGSLNTAFSASFHYDALTLGVSSASPATGAVVTLPTPGSTLTYDVSFNEPIDPATANPANLVLSQGTVTGATVLPGNTTVEYTLAGLTDGPLNISIPAGQLEDAADNPYFTPFSASYTVDIPTQPLPAFTAASPAGSLSYQTSASDLIDFGGDSDQFTLAADPGETLTVVVTANSPQLQPSVQLSSPSGQSLGSSMASAAGRNALLQTLHTTVGGTYTVTVTGAGGTAGGYTVQVYLDTAVEAASVGLGSDTGRSTAQSLTNAFVTLQTSLASASQATVVGSVGYAPVTLDATFSGWWDNTGYHDPTNPNYIAGQYNFPPLEKWHDFFVFDLSGITHTVAAAQLNLFNPSDGYYSTRTSDTYTLYGVSTSIAALEEAGSGTNQASEVAIYTDLGSGSNYGSTTVSSASDGQTVTTKLDSTALSDLNGDRGGQFPVGGALTTASSTHDQAIFADTGTGSETKQLVLTFTDSRYYSFSLTAGERVTVGLKVLTGNGVTLSLMSSGGTILAKGVAAGNLDLQISKYVATATNTYYLVVGDSTTNATYSLVVTRDAAFDTKPNTTFATAQDVTGARGAVGGLVTTDGTVVPGADTASETYDGNAYPFAWVSTMRYQQIYSAAEMGSGGVIDSLQFRRAYWQEPFTSTPIDIRISLGYAATTVLTASPNFADNIGPGGLVTVYSGSLVLASTAPDGTPQAFDIIINLLHDFAYDPSQGDLLLDISVFSSPGNAFALGASDVENTDSTTRIYSYDVNEPVGTVGFSYTYPGPYGLVTRFGFVAPPQPDWYKVTLAANQTALQLETSTPLGGPNQPVNALTPAIQLYDSTGTLIASGAVLADGRNQSLLATGLTPGATYYVEVTSANGDPGEYFLGVTPLQTPTVSVTVDDGGPGFSTSGAGWATLSGVGHGSTEHTHAPVPNGVGYAQWQYTENVTAGTSYVIYATWVAAPSNATNAAYKIYDGSTLLTTVTVNQTRSPNTGLIGGSLVQQLYVYTPTTSGAHTLSIRLSYNANGTVVADAIFDPPLAAPEPGGAPGPAPVPVLALSGGALAGQVASSTRSPLLPPVTLALTGAVSAPPLPAAESGQPGRAVPALAEQSAASPVTAPLSASLPVPYGLLATAPRQLSSAGDQLVRAPESRTASPLEPTAGEEKREADAPLRVKWGRPEDDAPLGRLDGEFSGPEA